MRKADAVECDRGRGGKPLVSLEPALCHGLAHRLLDLALRANPEGFEEFANTPVEDVLVHDRLLCAIIRLSGRR